MLEEGGDEDPLFVKQTTNNLKKLILKKLLLILLFSDIKAWRIWMRLVLFVWGGGINPISFFIFLLLWLK